MNFVIRARPSGELLASGIENESVIVAEGNWYFDVDAVQMDYLRVTERTYTCPYKGTCYWIDLNSPEVHAQNVAWVYQNPKPGWEHIKDRIGFYARDTVGTTAAIEQVTPAP